jgi:transcriptional regulator of aromatic amino acid metabolism
MEALADVFDEVNLAMDDEALAARCAAITTLITADSAATVEHLARRIHSASARAASPFVHVTAAVLPVEAARLTATCAEQRAEPIDRDVRQPAG